MVDISGRCLRPALPMNRAVFHRLGLSVGIAIALAGCGRMSSPIDDPDPDKEADPISYSTVGGYTQMDCGFTCDLARRVTSDGLLTENEYGAVIGAAKAEREAGYEAEKARIKGLAQSTGEQP